MKRKGKWVERNHCGILLLSREGYPVVENTFIEATSSAVSGDLCSTSAFLFYAPLHVRAEYILPDYMYLTVITVSAPMTNYY